MTRRRGVFGHCLKGLRRSVWPLFCMAASFSCKPSSPPASGQGPSVRPGASISGEGTIDLVETAPIETSLDHADIPNADEVWLAMIGGAKRTIDIAQFYVANAPDTRLASVIQAIESAAARKVVVRLLIDDKFYEKYPETADRLGRCESIAMRRIDVGATMGGVMHAKYFVVDGEEAYMGSQNFDWRSLTHIQELGVRIRHRGIAAAYESVFEMDWALAAGETAGTLGSLGAKAAFGESSVVVQGGSAKVVAVASPTGWLPSGMKWDLPEIVAMIARAQRSVRIQLLTYKPSSRDGTPFLDLDRPLRQAANRGVAVELLLADWCKRAGTLEPLQALKREVKNIEIRFVTIPPWSGGEIPFARVIHSKYMVVDGTRGWIGTSNWEGDYFTRSRNLGLVIDGAAFGGRLERLFGDLWDSEYAKGIDTNASVQ